MCPESSFVQLIHCLEHPQLTNVEKKISAEIRPELCRYLSWQMLRRRCWMVCGSHTLVTRTLYKYLWETCSHRYARGSQVTLSFVVPTALHGSWILLCRLVVELDNHLCTYIYNNLLLLYTKGTFSYCCFAVVTVSSFREPGPVHMCLLGIT